MIARRLLTAALVLPLLCLTGCGDLDDGPGEDSQITPTIVTPKVPLAFHQVAQSIPGACPEVAAPQIALEDPGTSECLVLDEALLSPEHLDYVEAELSGSSAEWVVNVRLVDADAMTFQTVTEELSNAPAPANRLAIVLGGERILTAPTVVSPIGGDIQISGGLSEQDAEDLATALGG